MTAETFTRRATDRAYWLSWDRIKGIGPHRLKRLWRHFGCLETAWAADAESLLAVEGIGEQLATQIRQERHALDPETILKQVEQKGIPLITPADPDYPMLLWELPDPPPLLYVLGEQPVWTPTVAMVGTRSPTPYGRRWTEKIATALAEAGFVVVSGMADGIDGIAHQACLHAGGQTLAVVGTGVDVVYPPKHRDLYRQILTQGAVVSEFAPGTQPAKENFPRRNRIIAGLCQATLVLEAPEKSGALITAYLANDYNRDVFALPGNIDTREARGCLKLIQTGAAPILDIEELLAALGSSSSSETALSTQRHVGIDLQGDQLAIWQVLSTEPMTFDAIAQATQLQVNVLSSALLMMELQEQIIQLPGLRYQRAIRY
jgi:DNA processing protein